MAKRRLQKQLKAGFAAETRRIARAAGETGSPLAKQVMKDEAMRRRGIAKGGTDGTTTKMEG